MSIHVRLWTLDHVRTSSRHPSSIISLNKGMVGLDRYILIRYWSRTNPTWKKTLEVYCARENVLRSERGSGIWRMIRATTNSASTCVTGRTWSMRKRMIKCWIEFMIVISRGRLERSSKNIRIADWMKTADSIRFLSRVSRMNSVSSNVSKRSS